MEERNNNKENAEIALQARLNENNKKSKGKWLMMSKGNFLNFGGRESQNSKISTCQKGNGLRDNNTSSENAAKTCCNWLFKDNSQIHAKENVMVTVRKRVQCIEEWYLDFSCSMHMKGRKDWFVKINQATKNKVKFTDDTTLTVDGTCDVLIIKRGDGYSLSKDVLYIPEIKCNLIRTGQLLEKGYMIHMEDKTLHVMDANRTFKVELMVTAHRCLATTVSQEEWL
ncbi:uncharacterized protein LOC131632455 [Vicia villosa]|uniref:uncharacterized protein LOC131632455 n=1 Tax=Vicia villosa TaxID=3911 RepID=UPI00273C81F7|nr:uncharacterized protein LOC131632455 [Vicia villosa]